MHTIKKGDELTLDIDSLAFGGRGIARYDECVLFVKNAIPGQKVKALVYRKKKGYAEARTLSVIHESPFGVQAPCLHFGVCGGCKVQNLTYEEQLNQKAQQVEEIFRRLGEYPDFKLSKIIGAENIFHYRNKMEFTFSPYPWIIYDKPEEELKPFALGLHIPGRFDKILNISDCHIQPEIGNKLLNEVRNICLCHPELAPYSPKKHTGFLRHLVLRYGFHTNQLMVNIVTAYDDMKKLSPLIDGLLEKFSEITSFVNNINTRKSDVAYGEYENLIYGSPVIEETLGDLTFEISANSFFQTNTIQAEVLYNQILSAANLSGNEVIYDLYCGTGSISLYLASQSKMVYGFEVIRSSLENAERNAKRNNIHNVQFIKANLDTYFKSNQLPRKFLNPDIVILDPPRSGLHPDMKNYLQKFDAGRIIYVSCNPATQARDVQSLWEVGYKITKSILVDMFPHTPHIEIVTVLER